MGSIMDGIKASMRERRLQGRQEQIRDILARSYQPTPGAELPGPTQTGAPLREQLPGQLNIQSALQQMYQNRLGPEALQLQSDLAKMQANRTGMTPSAVREHQYWQNLPDQEKEDYLKVKRAQKFLDVGSGFVAPTMVDPTQTQPVAPRQLRPTERPEYISEKIDVEKRGRAFTKTDEKFSTEYVKWKTGGFADTAKNLDQLNAAVNELETSANELTGKFIGNVPDFALQFIEPRAIAVREQIEEVVQRNLREILGAQFTEKEGERLIARAYNKRLHPKENVKRIRRLMQQIGNAAKAKQEASDYFEQNGTLEGFKGKTYSMNDFMSLLADPKEKPKMGFKKGGYVFMGGDPSDPKSWKKQ